jgi:hypothetical protein
VLFYLHVFEHGYGNGAGNYGDEPETNPSKGRETPKKG